MKRHVRMVAAVLAVGLVAGACSKRQPPVQPTPDPVPQSSTPQPQPSAPRPTSNTGTEDAAVRVVLEQMVFFDYDESSIRQDAQQTLAAKVPHLRSSPSIRIQIDGHADERGSVEYNLALGKRRAEAVKQYLVDFGLEAGRFTTNSYGEDRPLSQGSTESAWSQNRRAEFRVAAGTIGR